MSDSTAVLETPVTSPTENGEALSPPARAKPKAKRVKPKDAAKLKATAKGKTKNAAKPAGKLHDGLRLPQYRTLRALLPNANGQKPCYSRAKLSVKAGFSAISGTINRALHGIKRNAPQAEYAGAHKGLLGLGLVKEIEQNIDDTRSVEYEITAPGIKAVARYAKSHGTNRKLRSREASINLRYQPKPLHGGNSSDKAGGKTKSVKK